MMSVLWNGLVISTHAFELGEPGLDSRLDLGFDGDGRAVSSHADHADGKGKFDEGSVEVHLGLSARGEAA